MYDHVITVSSSTDLVSINHPTESRSVHLLEVFKGERVGIRTGVKCDAFQPTVVKSTSCNCYGKITKYDHGKGFPIVKKIRIFTRSTVKNVCVYIHTQIRSICHVAHIAFHEYQQQIIIHQEAK
jgi:hypothetical protein